MPLMVLRFIPIRINKGRYKAATIGNHQLQSCCCSSFIVSSTVVRVPYKHTGHASVHSRCHQKGHAILNLWVFDPNIGNDCVADDGRNEDEEHDDSTELKAIGDDGYHNGDNRGNSVWNYRPELGFVGRVTEFDNYSWEKEAERVEASQNTKVGDSTEPSGNVQDTAANFGPSKLFVVMFTTVVRRIEV